MRRVERGSCGDPYGTACQHDPACLRCQMLSVNPKIYASRFQVGAGSHGQTRSVRQLGTPGGLRQRSGYASSRARHMRQRNNLMATPGMPVRSTDSRRLDVDHNTGAWTFRTRHIGNAERGTDDVEDNRTHSLVLQRAAADRLLDTRY